MKTALLLLLTFLASSYAFAQDIKSLSIEELKSMIDKKTKIVIVDARPEEEYEEGHIPAAINIPPEKFNFIATLLPKNKKTLIIFYCRGYG
jgi:rhodanese-related sulfurtransferase